MPFSCCVFLPDVAPGLTVLSLDAPGAVWLCADAMSVEPKSDVTTSAGIASLDRIRNVSVRVAGTFQTSGTRFRSSAWQTSRKYHLSEKPFVIAAQHAPLSKYPSPSEHKICAMRIQWLVRWTWSRGMRSVREPYQEPSVPKMRRDDGIADHRA